jgi:GTP-binding protein HflX
METLAELEVVDRPVVLVLNKIDLLPASDSLAGLLAELADVAKEDVAGCLPVSARQCTGLDAFLEEVEWVLSAGLVHITVSLPYARGDLAALFHEQGTVMNVSHDGEGTVLEGYLARRWLDQFRPYLV